jgi:hypothetical protein
MNSFVDRAQSAKRGFDTLVRFGHIRPMLKLSILVTSTVTSYAFWWAADALGADMFTGFLISSVGAIAGCWIGWKIYQRFLS